MAIPLSERFGKNLNWIHLHVTSPLSVVFRIAEINDDSENTVHKTQLHEEVHAPRYCESQSSESR